MKALVLHQPYATLVALGVKTIETCPAPPNGDMRPDGVRGLPGLPIMRGERIAIVAGAEAPKWGATYGESFTVDMWAGRDGFCLSCTDDGWSLLDLPLGAVVCTAVVAEALPMLLCHDFMDEDSDQPNVLWLDGRPSKPVAVIHQDGALSEFDLSSQIPYGDFAPGRWGWLLTDVQPCPPVPVKGRQGVFALPDDVEGL